MLWIDRIQIPRKELIARIQKGWWIANDIDDYDYMMGIDGHRYGNDDYSDDIFSLFALLACYEKLVGMKLVDSGNGH